MADECTADYNETVHSVTVKFTDKDVEKIAEFASQWENEFIYKASHPDHKNVKKAKQTFEQLSAQLSANPSGPQIHAKFVALRTLVPV